MDINRRVGIGTIYFKSMWIFAVALYILIPRDSSLMSIVYLGIHAVNIIAFVHILIMMLKNTASTMEAKKLLILIVISVVIIFSMTAFNTSSSVQIAGILGFIEMLIGMYVSDFAEYNDDLADFVFRINILISIIFIGLSFSPYAYSGIISDSLYLGYSNPNTTAIYILITMSILVIYHDRLSSFAGKTILWLIVAYLIYLIYLTDSRTCLVAAMIIIVYRIIGGKKVLPKWLIIISLLFPLVFLFLYSYLYSSGIFLDLEILGKPFYSGREAYFVSMIDNLKSYLWVGDVSTYYFTNMHNGPLTILSSIGIFGYVAYLIYVLITLNAYHENVKSNQQIIAMIIICAVFIHSSSEAVLVVGGAHYAGMIGYIFLVMRGENFCSDAEDIAENINVSPDRVQDQTFL